MSINKKKWYYGQPVKFSEMLGAFDGVIEGFNKRRVDFGESGIAVNRSVVLAPLQVNPNSPPGMSVLVTPGNAYDKNGLRMVRTSGTDPVSLAVDKDGAATIPAVGNERYLSLFILQNFIESDPRLDATGAVVYFGQELSHRFEVVAGTEALAGAAVKPVLRNDAVLLADILIGNGTTAINTAAVAYAPVLDEIDLTRTETWLRTSDGPGGQILSARYEMRNYGDYPSGTGKPAAVFTHEGLIQAWATVSSAGSLISSYGVTASAKTGTGLYTLTIPAIQTLANVGNCAVFITGRLGALVIGEGQLDPTDSTRILISTFTHAGVLADANFNVMIIGRASLAGALYV